MPQDLYDMLMFRKTRLPNPVTKWPRPRLLQKAGNEKLMLWLTFLLVSSLVTSRFSMVLWVVVVLWFQWQLLVLQMILCSRGLPRLNLPRLPLPNGPPETRLRVGIRLARYGMIGGPCSTTMSHVSFGRIQLSADIGNYAAVNRLWGMQWPDFWGNFPVLIAPPNPATGPLPKHQPRSLQQRWRQSQRSLERAEAEDVAVDEGLWRLSDFFSGDSCQRHDMTNLGVFRGLPGQLWNKLPQLSG